MALSLDTLQAWDAALAPSTAGYFARLYAGLYTISIAASLWVYCVAGRLPPGLTRAAACLPVVVLQLAATPLLVDRTRTPVLIVPVCGMLSLAAFKVCECVDTLGVQQQHMGPRRTCASTFCSSGVKRVHDPAQVSPQPQHQPNPCPVVSWVLAGRCLCHGARTAGHVAVLLGAQPAAVWRCAQPASHTQGR